MRYKFGHGRDLIADYNRLRAVNKELVKDVTWILGRLERGGMATRSDCISQANNALAKAKGE